MELLTKSEAEIPVIVGGSVITPGDRTNLTQMGVAATFGVWSSDKEIVETIRGLVKRRRPEVAANDGSLR
jgi:methylmalonyl-CoA mutase cobalamin-binding subunit